MHFAMGRKYAETFITNLAKNCHHIGVQWLPRITPPFLSSHDCVPAAYYFQSSILVNPKSSSGYVTHIVE